MANGMANNESNMRNILSAWWGVLLAVGCVVATSGKTTDIPAATHLCSHDQPRRVNEINNCRISVRSGTEGRSGAEWLCGGCLSA
jgi:hypothetical protein